MTPWSQILSAKEMVKWDQLKAEKGKNAKVTFKMIAKYKLPIDMREKRGSKAGNFNKWYTNEMSAEMCNHLFNSGRHDDDNDLDYANLKAENVFKSLNEYDYLYLLCAITNIS